MAAAAAVEEEKSIQELLSLPILLADRVIKSAQEAESSKPECRDLADQVTQLSQNLRALVRLTTPTAATPPTPSSHSQPLYDRPIRRVTADVTKTLDRALTLVRKCRRKPNVLRQVFAITTTADFRKLFALLDSSIADVKWVLSILESTGSTNLSLPPIASNDPILAWVWSNIATLHMGVVKARTDSAHSLASLALDNDRNKKIIIVENGIPPLLKLLKDNTSHDAQLAAAAVLYNLADCEERVRIIAGQPLGVQIIVKVLTEAPLAVQVAVVDLIARMAELDEVAKEEFGRENVTRNLVTLLGMDVVLDEGKDAESRKNSNLLSLVQINKEMVAKGTVSGSGSFSNSSFQANSVDGRNNRKEVESPEAKLRLKVSCANAMRKLAKGSLLTSRKITETKAMLVLAKIIEKEKGELQVNCLMAVKELASVAEGNADLRRVAFKPNSPAARAVLDQLLRVVNEERSMPLLVPAIWAIGCLARTFPAKETRIIGPLVDQLGHMNSEVATEAAIALGKFVCLDNFNHLEHSKAIIEFNGVPKLMNLLRRNDRVVPLHELVLLCYLAIHVGNSKALEQARALSFLEGAARNAVTQHPELKELFAKAIHHLTLYQAGGHTHRQAYVV